VFDQKKRNLASFANAGVSCALAKLSEKIKWMKAKKSGENESLVARR